MGFMKWITEQFYILFSVYYYEVFLYKDKIQIGRIIQAVSFNPVFIVDFERKLAWTIIKESAFIRGHKLILHYNLEYGLPLSETIEIQTEEITDLLIKTKKVSKLSANVTQVDKNKAKPMQFNEMNMPTSLIFELYNAYFVTRTLSAAKSTDWTFIFICAFAVIMIISVALIIVFGVFK